MRRTVAITPSTGAVENVVAGWLGLHVPRIPKHRSASRAGYRKTQARRPRRKAER